MIESLRTCSVLRRKLYLTLSRLYMSLGTVCRCSTCNEYISIVVYLRWQHTCVYGPHDSHQHRGMLVYQLKGGMLNELAPLHHLVKSMMTRTENEDQLNTTRMHQEAPPPPGKVTHIASLVPKST